MNLVGQCETSAVARTLHLATLLVLLPQRPHAAEGAGATALSVISLAIGSVLLMSSIAVAAEHGTASHYAASFHGRRTSSGERLDMHALTCAHRTAPFGTMLRVSSGGRFVVCRVTDRGSFARGRIIDLTPAAARVLGGSGVVHVTVERM